MKTHLIHVGGIYKDKNERVFVCVSMWFGYKEYVELYSVSDDKIVNVELEKMRSYIEKGTLVYYSPPK